MRKLFAFMAVFLLLASCAYSADRANNATDTETLGNDDFFVNSDGDLIPKTIGEQTLGNATHYLEEIYLNGVGKSEWGDIINFAADVSDDDGDPYVIALDPIPSALTTGAIYIFTVSDANSGACSLNVNSLGEKPIKFRHDADPAEDHFEAGSVAIVVYDGTNFQTVTQDANP